MCKIIFESEILCCIFVSLLNISDFDFARLVKCRTKCRPPLRQYQRICDSSEPALSARSSKHSIRFVMLEKKLSHFMPCPPARILERHPLYMTSDSLGWTSPEGSPSRFLRTVADYITLILVDNLLRFYMYLNWKSWHVSLGSS